MVEQAKIDLIIGLLKPLQTSNLLTQEDVEEIEQCLVVDRTKFVKISEAAKRFGVSFQTVKREIQIGRLIGGRMGANYIVSEYEMQRYIRDVILKSPQACKKTKAATAK